MITIVLVVAALLVLAFFVHATLGQRTTVVTSEEFTRLRAVDLEAFRNLVDPKEEEFLHDNLPPGEFRAIQRERLRAAIEYIACAAQNATILLHLGEAARANADPNIAAAGQQLVNSALRLRLYALHTVLKLYIGIALPGTPLAPLGIVERYQQLRGLVTQLSRLQYPGSGARISAAL